MYSKQVSAVKEDMKLQLDYYWMCVGNTVADMLATYREYKLAILHDVQVQTNQVQVQSLTTQTNQLQHREQSVQASANT